MLPQETIMTMAQSGQIPVAFVAPILAEKAEASQRAVEAEAMMAQEQMPPGSVIEKIIAQNAANETQANMPMMAPPMPEAQGNMPMMGAQMPQMSQMSQMPQPEDVGIGALPIPDGMIPGLAGGGIIAFKEGDLVEDEVDLNEITRGIDAASGIDSLNSGEVDLNEITRGIDAASGRNLTGKFSGLGEEAQVLAEERNRFLGPNQSVADLIAYNKEAEKRAAERAKSQFNTRLIEAGLLGLSGDSEYFGVNMGRMAPAVKGMSEDTEKQAEAKEARIKSELAAKGIERKEGEASFSQALAQRTADLDAAAKAEAARIAAGKPTDMRNYVNDFVNSARAQGDDKTPETVLRQRGAENYLALQGAALQRANIAGYAAETTAQSKAREFADRARDNVDNSLGKNYYSNENKRLRDLQKEDKKNRKEGKESNLAEQYMQDLYDREEARIKGSDGKPKPEAEAKPEVGTKPDAAKPAAPPAPPSINVGNDITTERLTGAELEKRIAELKDHPNRAKLEARLRASEADFKKRIAAEKSPKKVTSQADFDNLPEGTVYQLPNGVKGIKGGVAQSSVATPSPSAAAKPTIQSVKGAPAGATIGNLVEGKGYQVLDRNGKVIGYAR
jgi:hypothetical protein